MRKRAGLARALVLDPEIILFDEPDSGLDPVRTAYLNQLIVDLNAQTEATFLIVTHDINTARTVPDNIGLLFRRHLAMFGPREMLLSSDEPVVRQFLNAQRRGPDRHGRGEGRRRAGRRGRRPRAAAAAADPAAAPSSGVPPRAASRRPADRQAASRRQARVRQMLHTLPPRRARDAAHAAPQPDRSEPAACGSTGAHAAGARAPLGGRLSHACASRRDCGRAGRLFALCLDASADAVRRPFQVREFIQQAWFIASVTILPTAWSPSRSARSSRCSSAP